MLSSLFASFAAAETSLAIQRTRRAATAYGAAVVVACVGIGFLVAAAFIWTAQEFGRIEAALGFGVGFLVLAGLILGVHKMLATSRAAKQQQQRRADMTALGTSAAMALLPALMRSKGGIGAILGPVAALAAYAIIREHRKPDSDDGVAGE